MRRRWPIFIAGLVVLCIAIVIRAPSKVWTYTLSEGGFESPVDAPFFIRLLERTKDDGAAIHQLSIDEYGVSLDVDVELGDDVRIQDRVYRVEALRLWSGTVSAEPGVPLATLSVRHGDGPWTEDMFVADTRWQRIDPGGVLRLFVCEDEEDARTQIGEGFPIMHDARWGVRDTNRIHWFNKFTPGLAARTDDGAVVSLLAFEERPVDQGGPSIRVGIRKGDDARSFWVRADVDSQEAPVMFDCPTMGRDVIALYTWQDGKALVGHFHDGEVVETKALGRGAVWTPSGGVITIRLENILASAVAVPRRDSTLYEAVLTAPGVRLRLREGAAERVGDVLIRYRRLTTEAKWSYRVAVGVEGSNEIELRVDPEAAVSFELNEREYRLRGFVEESGAQGIRLERVRRFPFSS